LKRPSKGRKTQIKKVDSQIGEMEGPTLTCDILDCRMSLTLYTIDGIGTLRCAEGGEMPGPKMSNVKVTPLSAPVTIVLCEEKR
jgi:hypothetical protein